MPLANLIARRINTKSRKYSCQPGIPALGRQRQEDCKFKASLGHQDRPCIQKQNRTKSRKYVSEITNNYR
jgi:hypothetical protein